MVLHDTGKATSFSQNTPGPVYLVSACLVGLRTRYDAQVKPCSKCLSFLKKAVWIPVCPEQLGGLPTPRTAADLTGGDGHDVLARRARVVTREGVDVTENFVLGAKQVLELARTLHVKGVLFKSKSPSCGLTPKAGVAAALLQQHHFHILEF